MIRCNSNYLMLFGGLSDWELCRIQKDLCPDLTKEEMRERYKEAVKEKYNFMMIDSSERYPLLKYRRNLNELWIDTK